MVILRKEGIWAAELVFTIVLDNFNNNLSATYIKNSHCIPEPKPPKPFPNICSMLLPTIPFYASLLLPLTMAVDFRLTVLVPDKWKDTAVVNGKKSSTGVAVVMTRDSVDPESMGQCPCMQMSDGVESCDSKNYGVAKTNFSRPTTNPRPITIVLPDYTLQVSIKTLSC
jgi:hypothetical protein